MRLKAAGYVWWVVAIVLLASIAVGARFGIDRVKETRERKDELRRQFAELKDRAGKERGLPRAVKLALDGNIDAAIEILEKETASTNVSTEARIELARMYVKRGRRQDAIYQYDLALDQDPRNKDILDEQTELLLKDGRIASVCENLKVLLTMDPNDIDIRFKLANLQYQEKEYSEAANNYGKVLVLKGEDATALQGLGHIHLYQNRTSDALGYYERAVAVDPGIAECWYFIARIYLFREDYESAVPALRKAVSLGYPDRDLLLFLGTALEYLGRIPEAIDTYKRFVAANPRHPKAEYIKMHISELEFWEEPSKFESRNIGTTPRPWGETIIPGVDQGSDGGGGFAPIPPE